MKAADIEQKYQETLFGHDEPDIAYCNGKTLKEMAAKCGEPVSEDSDGNPIRDGELYCMTRKGIWLIE